MQVLLLRRLPEGRDLAEEDPPVTILLLRAVASGLLRTPLLSAAVVEMDCGKSEEEEEEEDGPLSLS